MSGELTNPHWSDLAEGNEAHRDQPSHRKPGSKKPGTHKRMHLRYILDAKIIRLVHAITVSWRRS